MSKTFTSLEPKLLWQFFEEISRIPRSSKNEGAMIDYILGFARDRGLEYKQDKAGNIAVKRPAHSGFEQHPTVVLQSHVDMVCEKNADSAHDFSRDPISLRIDGDWMRAESTSLGADNGIGVAAMLSILHDNSLSFGELEMLFTVEEEVGLNGAMDLDTALISGCILINLDTEEVGTLYIGCAGGRDSDLYVPMTDAANGDLDSIEIGVTGLRGGHSGAEIHLGGANAVKLLFRLMKGLQAVTPLNIVSIRGGDKHNAIPREASARIAFKKKKGEALLRFLDERAAEVKRELVSREPGLCIHRDHVPVPDHQFDTVSSARLIDVVSVIPHGVLVMSGSMDDLVETSSNLSSIASQPDTVHIHTSHRSSVESALDWVCEIHGSIAGLAGARIEQDRGYPAWNPDPASAILGIAKKGVEKVLGRAPKIRAIHAGLECGVIKRRFEGMDAISIGPTIRGAHSPDERVHIESVEQFWNILVEILHGVRTAV
jgi:dipeptidase D